MAKLTNKHTGEVRVNVKDAAGNVAYVTVPGKGSVDLTDSTLIETVMTKAALKDGSLVLDEAAPAKPETAAKSDDKKAGA